ncbi:hypothetical protein [Paraglaciecola polaris]|uniref:hypothetical protein n=1 Tax=Paraglaciecola polaris TaxID=222814 RepID=UPI0030EF4D16|tara:strand:- start:355 stop:1029 length:675 start_codon:yes stop_codon:yes gene_type:complete
MRYSSLLPFSALLVLGLMSFLIHVDIIPPGIELLESLKARFDGYLYWLILAIILLESIVYVGFYFPGQFFAVLLVVLAKPQWNDILYLTLAMVTAATLGSMLNYYMGKRFAQHEKKTPINRKSSIKYLLVAMIHINSLAFYMFNQGAQRRPFKVVFLAGLLNLPYYLGLIFATTVLSEEIMKLAENTLFILCAIGIWLLVCVYLDIKKYRNTKLYAHQREQELK